jgi:hypothetical protein
MLHCCAFLFPNTETTHPFDTVALILADVDLVYIVCFNDWDRAIGSK